MKHKILLLAIMLIASLASMKVAATQVYNYSYRLAVGQYVDFCLQHGGSLSQIDNSSPDIVVCRDLGWTEGNRYVRFGAIQRGTAQVTVLASNGVIVYYVTINVIDVVNITLPMSLSLTVGDDYIFNPIIADAGAPTSLSWQSYNNDVATVDSNGKLTAVGVGTATIICSASNGVSGQCQVTVNPKVLVSSVGLSTNTLNLKVGDMKQIYPIVLPDNAANKVVSWETSDADIATVDDEGHITAVSPGQATITAMSTDGTYKSATCEVNVTPIVAKGLTVNPTSIELNIGGTYLLTATVAPETAQQRVVWSSSDKDIAKVVGGTVYAMDWGECLITATTVDGSNLTASCLITVLPEQSPQTGKRGDLNNDNIVDVSDINDLIDIVLGK